MSRVDWLSYLCAWVSLSTRGQAVQPPGNEDDWDPNDDRDVGGNG